MIIFTVSHFHVFDENRPSQEEPASPSHNSEWPVPAVSKETASTQIAEIIHVKNNGIEYKLLE